MSPRSRAADPALSTRVPSSQGAGAAGQAALVVLSQEPLELEVTLGPPPVKKISKSSQACPPLLRIRPLPRRFVPTESLYVPGRHADIARQTPTFQTAPAVPQPLFTKSRERKQRYLRDRIHSLTGSEVKVAAAESAVAAVENEGDDDDPYAWLSQTAPASPESERHHHHRSRDETG